MMKLRFAVVGTGYWANFQIPAWMELEGIELVALYNRTKSKAEILARQYSVPRVYDNFDLLLQNEDLDFIDIITDVESHADFTERAMKKGVAVVCQKPMAPTLETARRMLDTSRQFNVKFMIHENWRWQAPIRKVKSLLASEAIGKIFKARVTFCSAFPVFENQPFLAELDQFILMDIGSHILDVCRFLFGEVEVLHCHTARVNSRIKGEDVANVLMRMKNGISCYAEMSYASILEDEVFPQTLILVEGEHGSIKVLKDYQIHVTTREGTKKVSANPEIFPWIDQAYALVHSSIVDCNRDILHGLKGEGAAETSGEDNFETVRLVHASYASARDNKLIYLKDF